MKKTLTCAIIGAFSFLNTIAQTSYSGTYYRVERSKASMKRGVGIEEMASNTYHFQVKKDQLLLSFHNPQLLEKFFLKKITKLSLIDTNGGYKKEWDADQLKTHAEEICIKYVKERFDKDLDKDREHLHREITKVLGGGLKDSSNAIQVITATREEPEKIKESVNKMLNRAYPVASFNKLQPKISPLVDKYNEARAKNGNDIKYFLDKPQRILDEILDKNLKGNWTLVLDTVETRSFCPAGYVLEFYGGKKWNWFAFKPYPEISLVKLKFDTINGKALANLPLLDTSTCKTDIIFGAFDAKHGVPFAHAKCNNITHISCFGEYTPTAYQKEQFTVNFAKGVTTDVGSDVKTRIEELHKKEVYLRHVHIAAYSSVEGDSTLNANLAHERSMQIIKEFQKYSRDSITYEIETNENWGDFMRDLPTYPYADKWKTLDRSALRKEVNAEGIKEKLEPWLDKQRYALIEMSYSEHVPKDQILTKVKNDYDTCVSNYPKHPIISEMKIAGIRHYLIGQYRHKTYTNEMIKPYFEFTNPRLDIVNAFQQYPIYKKNLPTINLAFDSILIRALSATVDLYELTAKNNTGKENNNRGVNSPQHQLRTFQIQLLRFAVKMVQEGKLSKDLLVNWKFPELDDYQFLALKAVLKDMRETEHAHAQESYSEKNVKYKDSTVSIPIFDYTLKQCGMKVVCKDSPFYNKVKDDLTKHVADEGYDNTVSEILWQFFIENQIVQTKPVEKILYDKDITPEKTLEYLDKFSAHLCSSKKDKLFLMANRNIALYNLKTENYLHVKPALEKILGYYYAHKELVPAEVIDNLIRFVVYFQPCMEDKNESIKEINKLIHSIQSKDHIFNTQLLDKTKYLIEKGEY